MNYIDPALAELLKDETTPPAESSKFAAFEKLLTGFAYQLMLFKYHPAPVKCSAQPLMHFRVGVLLGVTLVQCPDKPMFTVPIAQYIEGTWPLEAPFKLTVTAKRGGDFFEAPAEEGNPCSLWNQMLGSCSHFAIGNTAVAQKLATMGQGKMFDEFKMMLR